jgi:hypothetical protein
MTTVPDTSEPPGASHRDGRQGVAHEVRVAAALILALIIVAGVLLPILVIGISQFLVPAAANLAASSFASIAAQLGRP